MPYQVTDVASAAAVLANRCGSATDAVDVAGPAQPLSSASSVGAEILLSWLQEGVAEVTMEMQTAKNELVTAVMSKSGDLQKALILLQGKNDEVTTALAEILQASETYVFARIDVRQ